MHLAPATTVHSLARLLLRILCPVHAHLLHSSGAAMSGPASLPMPVKNGKIIVDNDSLEHELCKCITRRNGFKEGYWWSLKGKRTLPNITSTRAHTHKYEGKSTSKRISSHSWTEPCGHFSKKCVTTEVVRPGIMCHGCVQEGPGPSRGLGWGGLGCGLVVMRRLCIRYELMMRQSLTTFKGSKKQCEHAGYRIATTLGVQAMRTIRARENTWL